MSVGLLPLSFHGNLCVQISQSCWIRANSHDLILTQSPLQRPCLQIEDTSWDTGGEHMGERAESCPTLLWQVPLSMDSPAKNTQFSCICRIGRWVLTTATTWEASPVSYSPPRGLALRNADSEGAVWGRRLGVETISWAVAEAFRDMAVASRVELLIPKWQHY